MKRRLAARIAGSVVLALGTFSAAAMPATATAPPAPDTAKATTMLQAMQRDLGLTKEQALQRLDIESKASKLEKTLREDLAGSYGGSYFDAKLGKLVVGVTDMAQADLVRSAGAEVRKVEHSAAELHGITEKLSKHSGNLPGGLTGWYSQARTNSVTVTTKPGTAQQAAEFVRSTGVDTDAVKIVESGESPKTLADVIGGQAYYIGSGSRCSVGFSVEGGFVSAGHCGSEGDTTTDPSGTFAGSVFPGNDYSYIEVAEGETPQPLVQNDSGTVGVAGSTEAAEGASICRSGSTTGWHCGTVVAHDQSVSYPEGTVNGLTRTDVCAEPGDSGGSFISDDQAQGMTSGGSGDCSSGGVTYYQPVNPALDAFGVTLLTQ